ncbi:heparin lyase I family protein [uncultured Sphingomonas sp.]|uniref:heparin lyase I family protein n=1 Tax=uncultured Sphingomonas sp. TaxID=158754 RepID=UPI0025F71B93|nr:heparin lyase I family protein [uncultured Sphingomonas sp.]
MKRLATFLALGTAAIAGTTLIQRSAAQGERVTLSDDFDRGLCVGRCAASPWAIAQQIRGRARAAPAPDRSGLALLAEAGAKTDGVAKADVVARLRPVGPGRRITVAFDLRVPAGTPLNSLQLVDLECASCGEGGNPGIRLYLRRGRLRVDRSKIGIEHAWTRDDAPTLANDRWHHVEWQVRVAADDRGATRVLLDGRDVLAARGATAAALPRVAIDRVQIGITANSNAVPATAWFDNVRVDVR